MKMTSHLNGEDVGNINHSRVTVKDIDIAVYETMKDDLRENLEIKLDCTDCKRPVGLVLDKMTPNKETGQITAIIAPVPENSLSQNLLVPLMLDVPTLKQHDADGLAKSAKNILNDAGVDDEQLEGVGCDGEYILKGFIKKLTEKLNILGMTDEEKLQWITAVWEPAHQLELMTKDCKKMAVFDWFNEHIDVVNDAAKLLNIGKGLEQSKEAAEEVGEEFYTLRTLSDTRFAAYFEKTLGNFECRLETTIAALKKRIESKDKDVKKKASDLLKKICNKEFLVTNLGLLDVYRLPW